MGFEIRKKSGRIFDGSKLNVPGQGIYNVLKQTNNINKVKRKEDSVGDTLPTPTPSSTPQPTPTPSPPCWSAGFTLNIYYNPLLPTSYQVLPFFDSGFIFNGKPIYTTNPEPFNMYFDGVNWIFDYLTDTVSIGTTPIQTFTFTVGVRTETAFTSCGDSNYICVTVCDEFGCSSSTFFEYSLNGNIRWTPSPSSGTYINYSAETNDYVLWVTGELPYPIGVLSGLTSNDYPVGDFIPVSTYTAMTSTLGYCSGESICNCTTFIGDTGDDTIRYLDCNGIINEQFILSGQSINKCIIDRDYVSLSGNTSTDECYTSCP